MCHSRNCNANCVRKHPCCFWGSDLHIDRYSPIAMLGPGARFDYKPVSHRIASRMGKYATFILRLQGKTTSKALVNKKTVFDYRVEIKQTLNASLLIKH